VAHALHRELVERGAQVRLGTTVAAVRDELAAAEVTLSDGSVIAADRVVVCAGLHADRLARASGRSADPCIIPFRGEYYALRPGRETLVRGLIYPVPEPSLPFLGVHLTKRIDGRVLVGPNAILALAREGYNRFSFDNADVRDIVLSSGMRRLARRYWRTAATEIGRASSRRLFIQAARQYVPELVTRDVVPARAGVRAQAVSPTGELIDDFVLDHSRHVVWVRNAPSPAATSSFAIAEELLGRL
jgi:L-2-hydroxyglutarate oxidase LhgO